MKQNSVSNNGYYDFNKLKCYDKPIMVKITKRANCKYVHFSDCSVCDDKTCSIQLLKGGNTNG